MLAPHLLTLARTPCQEVLMYLRDSPTWVIDVRAYGSLALLWSHYQRKITLYLLPFNVMYFGGKLVTFMFSVLFTPVRLTRTPHCFRMPDNRQSHHIPLAKEWCSGREGSPLWPGVQHWEGQMQNVDEGGQSPRQRVESAKSTQATNGVAGVLTYKLTVPWRPGCLTCLPLFLFLALPGCLLTSHIFQSGCQLN